MTGENIRIHAPAPTLVGGRVSGHRGARMPISPVPCVSLSVPRGSQPRPTPAGRRLPVGSAGCMAGAARSITVPSGSPSLAAVGEPSAANNHRVSPPSHLRGPLAGVLLGAGRFLLMSMRFFLSAFGTETT